MERETDNYDSWAARLTQAFESASLAVRIAEEDMLALYAGGHTPEEVVDMYSPDEEQQ